jgi:hypothetical protein
MAVCPLCSSRPAKRFCPAKDRQICAICCGTKREIEIDCPSNCSYLRAGRDYEAEKGTPDPELMARVQRIDEDFLFRFTPVLNMIGREVIVERAESSWLVDNDLVEVLKALTATMKTLSSGIYYESTPGGSIRQSLFRRLKRVIDHAMTPEQELLERALRPSEAIDVLEFLTVSIQAKSSNRPKSRRYLDWLTSMLGISPVEESRSGLILP